MDTSKKKAQNTASGANAFVSAFFDETVFAEETGFPLPTPSEGWRYSLMGSVSTIVGGGTPEASDETNFNASGMPWITPADLSGFDSLYISRGRRCLSKKGLAGSSAKPMPTGSILMSSRAPIGYLAIAANEIATNQGFKSFVPTTALVPEYGYYWLCFIRPLLETMGSGTTFAEISGKRAAEIPILLAPVAEQRRIVEQVEALLARVNAARARLARAPALLKAFRQAVLSAAFSGRLTEEWRADHLPNISLDSEGISEERRKAWQAQCRKRGLARRYVDPVKPREKDLLPEIPSEWRWISADSACSFVTDGEHIQPRYQAQGKPLLTAKHIRTGYIQFSDFGKISESDFARCLKRCAPAQGDVLVVSVGATTGRAALVRNEPPFAIVRSVLLLRPLLLSEYILRWCESPWCYRWMTEASGASAQPHFYISDAKEMPVPLCSKEEQHEIVRRIEALFALADTIEAKVAAAQKRADALIQAILAKAFRGELVPTEAALARAQGRPYQSAGDLLERNGTTGGGPSPHSEFKRARQRNRTNQGKART